LDFFPLKECLSSYLNSSGTNYDPVRDIYHNNTDLNNNENPQPEGHERSNTSNENEKDTDRLYTYLKPGENNRIEDTNLFSRYNNPNNYNKVKDMKRILKEVRKENPDFFTQGEQNDIARNSFTRVRLRTSLLENIKRLKKDYPC
jgi:hypothetical protein